MRLIKKKLSELKEHPLNDKTRKITSEALRKLGVSIDTLGTIQPVVWNKRLDCICSGHQRVKVYRSKKIEEIDVWVVDLNEHDHCLAMYTLNNHYGEFDEEVLGDIVKGVIEADSLEVDTLGIDEKKIENYLKESQSDDLLEERFCSTMIFDNAEQKKQFIEYRKKFRNSSELAELATEKLKSWT